MPPRMRPPGAPAAQGPAQGQPPNAPGPPQRAVGWPQPGQTQQAPPPAHPPPTRLPPPHGQMPWTQRPTFPPARVTGPLAAPRAPQQQQPRPPTRPPPGQVPTRVPRLIRRVGALLPTVPPPAEPETSRMTLAEHMRAATHFEPADWQITSRNPEVFPVEGGQGSIVISPRARLPNPRPTPPPLRNRGRRRRERDPVVKIERNKENLNMKDLAEMETANRNRAEPRLQHIDYPSLPVVLAAELNDLQTAGRGAARGDALNEIATRVFDTNPTTRPPEISTGPPDVLLPHDAIPAVWQRMSPQRMPLGPELPGTPTRTPITPRGAGPQTSPTPAPRYGGHPQPPQAHSGPLPGTRPPVIPNPNAQALAMRVPFSPVRAFYRPTDQVTFVQPPADYQIPENTPVQMMPGRVIEETWEEDETAPMRSDGTRPMRRRVIRREQPTPMIAMRGLPDPRGREPPPPPTPPATGLDLIR